ncbi:Leucine Rich Repeat (LRR)-containing protein [Bernardetia litoralis DSM 6794]|uniref:Leucine Rich Repeat (LRR)-containing protein n=1 Tax=Bernardetia litoralis (strain ATCC 23117 / DSM 6794 / NBRC 15988 / NCIMB 1366 / Fx l1 / Sio-4) TaxID=880071 RepID=I4ALN1_BERLS|nr:leucine-rich repeat domain-containing protein [Bernardetia litoralis]AFM04866.1 Leucine Rich Repeat (LRR)-containing protein [Bernardetia litoralis DSM 6794]
MKNYLFPLLLILFFYNYFSINSFAQRTVIANDSLALIDIYQNTNGENWSNPWQLNQKVTTWNGITIENQRVVALNLNGRGLIGQLPNSLENLSELKTLNISSNNLTGSLEMLASLSNLKSLSMAATNYKNSYGNVPSIFGQIRQLTSLNIAQNGFTSPISDTTGFFLLTNLEELYIHSNSFVGTMQSEFGNFRNLKKFHIASSRFSGILPASLRNLTQLEEFYLAKNNFNSDLGEVISVMPNLRVLSAASNQLGRNRQIPLSLYNLSRLTYLDLSNNEYDFFIHPRVSQLQNLETLLLNNNKLTQNIPSSLGNLSKLKNCNLSHNLLNGEIPIQVYYAPSLITLNLSYNQFKDVLPTGLNLPSVLSYLDLSHNLFQTEPLDTSNDLPFDFEITYSFNSFINLTYLDLSFNNLHQFEKIDFYELTKLGTIKLNNNRLDGELSEQIATISSLALLNISTNRFRGTLPSEIGNMRSIQTFIASKNNLEGKIPNSFFMQSSSLHTLDLSKNKFTKIDNIDSLTNLQSLDVSNNNLTFEDLEEQIHKISNFNYSPQNKVAITEPCYLEIQTAGNYNHYQWFFNGDSIQNATDSILAAKWQGTYYVKIKNDSVPNLILQSENAVITEFTVPDNHFPNENFKDTTFCEPFNYELIATSNAIEYLWSTGDTTKNITISEEGIYTIWVDNGFCTVMDTVRINFAGVKNNIISSSQQICKNETPSLLTGDSSLVNHTYLWQSSTDSLRWSDLDSTLNYQPQELLTSTYFRRKVTPDSCDAKYSNVILIEVSNLKIEANTTNVSCFGGNNGKIDLEIIGAFGNYQIFWEDGTTQNSLENLSKGDYKVKIIDDLGCQDSLIISVSEPQLLEGNFIIQEATCNTELNDGKISLEIIGGTEPYRTIWTYKETTIATNTTELSNLEPNEIEKYQVKIIDANGCEITLSDFVIRRKPIDARFNYEYESYCRLEINPKPIILNTIENQNSFFFTTDTGISLDSLSGEIKLNQSNQGIYKIVYQADECSADTVFIEINEDCFAGIPNTFTPNNDGTNDTWQISFLERYPNADVEIFDRTGKILFTQKNGYNKEWDALLNGMKLAEGTYYYRIRISDSLKPIMGYISVVR